MHAGFPTFVAIGVGLLVLNAGMSAQHQPERAHGRLDCGGQELYDRDCAECHGPTGRGDGKKGEGLAEKPSDFTDEKWEHGTTDGELFVVIRDGAGPKSEMKGFVKKLKANEIWDVVNFVRTLGPRKSHE